MSSDIGLATSGRPTFVDFASDMLEVVARCDDDVQVCESAVRRILAFADAGFAAVIRGQRGTWDILAGAGPKMMPPTDLLADVLDRNETVCQWPWCAAPLNDSGETGEVLALWFKVAATDDWPPQLSACATNLAAALAAVRKCQRKQERIERLATILQIGVRWVQTLETDTLLQQVAEASTHLLRAERASIFLWDKPNGMLVARPALGVAGGELRIGDDVGVVGKTVQTGRPQRVDADEDQSAIDRRVDKQLDFETRSLLCVPLRASDGTMLGAFEMINKIGGNFTEDDETALSELAAQAAIALENTQQYEQLLKVRNQMTDQAAAAVKLIGNCPAIEALRSTVSRIADTELAVLILGENGTGKEVVSQLIHYLSHRRNQPMVAVNCAALTESLLESELFGHEKGAFTDAREARAGKFELADGGTLFLDEIGDMSLSGQAKLLRVLEEKIVVRVGGSTPIAIDTRVIAATNQNLAEMVRQKRFREDLFFRLNVVTLDIPPLRQRGDDILLLAEHFLQDFCLKARRKPPKFTAAARKRLLGHAWPGNVRELRNLMERLAYLSQGDRIDADELAFILAPDSDTSTIFSSELPLAEATQRFQEDYIKKQIEAARGNMTDAARRLGLHRSNLYRKMRQLDLETQE